MSELFNLLNLIIGLVLGIIIGGLVVKFNDKEVEKDDKRKGKK